MSRKTLLTGRAGSGKTHRVLERAGELLRSRRTERLLLFLPTQSQVDHVRSLLLRGGIPAFRDDFAHTFFSFSRSLVRDLPEQLLSEDGRDYLIADLLRLESLPAFGAVRNFPGFRRLLGRAFKELKDNGITPEAYARRILEPLSAHGEIAGRHRDLGRAFAAYGSLLAESGRIDQETLTLSALSMLEEDPALLADRELLLVDGFHDFTPIQLRILALLAERIPESVFTLSFDMTRAESPIFGVSARTRKALARAGFEEVALSGNHRTSDPTLRHLEAHLFGEQRPLQEAGAGIRITRAARREEEVEGIARSILRLVREEKVPYRDIALLYHDLSEMADLVEGTFQRFGIPVRLYHPRPMMRQPLVRFLLDLGRILAGGPDQETLIRLLRSGYVAGLDLSEVDRLDASLRRGRPPGLPEEWRSRCASLNLGGVRRVLGILSEAGPRLRGKHGFGTLKRAWLDAFYAIALPLAEKGPRVPEEGEALEAFLRLVDEAGIRITRGKGNPTLGVLLESVEAGVAEATFRVRDRRREAVNVINAFEARQWEVSVLFVGGLLERQFPPAPVEDLFFTDDDRQRLEAAGLRFPGRRWRQEEERFLFYTALTRARTRLHLSYPVADSNGNPTLPSFFLREVEQLFTEGSLKARIAGRQPSAVLPPPEEVVLEEEVDRLICLGLADRFPKGGFSRLAALAGAFYHLRRADPGFRRRIAAALQEPRPELTSPGVLQDLAHRDTPFSNGALSSFHQCPYLHFAEKWLRLESLPERNLTTLEMGEVLHAVMREWLEDRSSGDPLQILARRFEDLAAAKRPTFRQRAEYWRLLRTLRALVRDEERLRESRRFLPARFEVSFGAGPGAGPAVPLAVGGREERLSGRIDRIDLTLDGRAGLVVDYKYSKPARVREQWKAGAHTTEAEDFQLAIYLLALRETLGVEPAGAELVALKGRLERMGILQSVYEKDLGLPPEARRAWRVLDERSYNGFIARARSRIADRVEEIRRGGILTNPEDPRRCGPGFCPAADVCRFDRWLGRQGDGTEE